MRARESMGEQELWTIMEDDMQRHCSDAFIQIEWVLFRMAMYRPSGYNRIFCVAVSTELWYFEMPKPAGKQCNVLRMRANPGWGTW